MINNQRGPNLSNNVPVTGFMSPIKIAPGINMRPDSNGEKPSISCIKIGSMIAPPIIDINETIPIAVAIVKVLNLKIRNCKIGVSIRNCKRMKKNKVIEPTTIEIMVSVANQPASPATLKP